MCRPSASLLSSAALVCQLALESTPLLHTKKTKKTACVSFFDIFVFPPPHPHPFHFCFQHVTVFQYYDNRGLVVQGKHSVFFSFFSFSLLFGGSGAARPNLVACLPEPVHWPSAEGSCIGQAESLEHRKQIEDTMAATAKAVTSTFLVVRGVCNRLSIPRIAKHSMLGVLSSNLFSSFAGRHCRSVPSMACPDKP